MRVLVPRGGDIGDRLRIALEAGGHEAVIAPLIDFEPVAVPAETLAALAAGEYEWLLLTSATAVDMLRRLVEVPPSVRIGVVGAQTAKAASAAGWRVAGHPAEESGIALARMHDYEGRVLLPQSERADPALHEELLARGVDVDRVALYRPVPLPADAAIQAAVAAGAFGAILLTSGSVAERVAGEFAPLPESARIVVIGPRTAADAEAAGLRVAAIAESRSAAALAEALNGLEDRA